MKSIFATIVMFASLSLLFAQSENKPQFPENFSEKAFQKAAPSVVKLIFDNGETVGSGVILAVHKDNVGFILTSYSLIAGRDKVAVILKNYPDALLGYVVEKFIDFDLGLAVVALKNFPAGQPVITLKELKNPETGKSFSTISHVRNADWSVFKTTIQGSAPRFFTISSDSANEIGFGAPLLTKKGEMCGLIVKMEEELNADDSVYMKAVNVSAIKPMLDEWFHALPLKQKWHEQGAGIASWMWAVGGGVLGGTVAAIVTAGGGSGGDGPAGLPRPPQPPKQ